MPSPFPGMDPYIESSGYWGDFHGGMNAAIRAELNARLPAGYAASIELFVWFHEPDAAQRVQPLKPDVYVTEGKGPATGSRTAAVRYAAAKIVLPGVRRKEHKYIQVEDIEAQRVVTVLEMLSPANKDAGDDREAYLAKRRQCFVNRLNFVEIDLLRGGRRLPLSTPPPATSDYYVLISRAWEWPRADFCTFGLREPLPEIPVPLGKGLPEVALPLDRCVARAYDEGRYAARLRYDAPLTPRLRKPDAAWVKKLLADRAGSNR